VKTCDETSFILLVGRILFGACGAGNLSACQWPVTVFGNGQHGGIGTSMLEEDSDTRARFQHCAAAYDLPLRVGDDAVAAGEYRLRVQMGKACSQAAEIGGLAVQHLVERAMEFWCQRLQAAGVTRRIGADQQQATGQVG